MFFKLTLGSWDYDSGVIPILMTVMLIFKCWEYKVVTGT